MNKIFEVIVQADHNFMVTFERFDGIKDYYPDCHSRRRLTNYMNSHRELFTPYYSFMAHDIGIEYVRVRSESNESR